MSQLQQSEPGAGEVQYFRLPDAGEGLTEAEIVTWKVKPGDSVRVNDPIVEVETAKSLVELPCPFAGVVTELLAPEGSTVPVGTPIIAVSVTGSALVRTEPAASAPGTAPSAQGTAPSAVRSGPAEGAVEPGPVGGPAPGGRTPVLVGYGPRTTAAVRRPRVVPAAGTMARGTAAPAVPAAPAPAGASGVVHALAKPPVRKLARDLGIDLAGVPATGPGGIVTREDVEHAAAGAVPAATVGGTAAVPVAAGVRETRIPVRGVRKLTAEAMVASAFTAPHVTEWLSVDVTRTMRLVDRLREDREFTGVKVGPLLVVAKALLVAARRHPGINASWDAAAGEIVVKHYVNLGVAAATPRGLVVPNIKDADRLTLRELADALADLTATAREGRTPPSSLAGGTITITNVGVFGVDAGTPILNPGEAAILAFGQVRQLPWVHKGKVRPRWVTQLALSFDHRLVDGDLGSRFLADVGAVLEDPARVLVWG
ncbi:MAG TPA: dihydrolipoamide acetyltransferase family protein [Kineosporiaceae bacterium]|nr:dihydrolipoamide acetyltransferase family protein [Kineosporiaceae bacterium]